MTGFQRSARELWGSDDKAALETGGGLTHLGPPHRVHCALIFLHVQVLALGLGGSVRVDVLLHRREQLRPAGGLADASLRISRGPDVVFSTDDTAVAEGVAGVAGVASLVHEASRDGVLTFVLLKSRFMASRISVCRESVCAIEGVALAPTASCILAFTSSSCRVHAGAGRKGRRRWSGSSHGVIRKSDSRQRQQTVCVSCVSCVWWCVCGGGRGGHPVDQLLQLHRHPLKPGVAIFCRCAVIVQRKPQGQEGGTIPGVRSQQRRVSGSAPSKDAAVRCGAWGIWSGLR